MNSRTILLAGAAVVALAVAFGGGYYLSRPSAPTPIQPPAPAPTAAVTPAAPATAPVTPVPPPVTAAAVPVVPAAPTPAPAPRRRYADYTDHETEYAPPPPPPPPREREFHGPDPFTGHFSPFPMRSSGRGTVDAPLTWIAQTGLGEGHEADLRIAIVVPEPRPDDNGEFWRQWGGRDQDDLMPEITRGTPIVVTGSISVIVAVDPELLDLDAPATLIVSGSDGRRVYRSGDVAPARGEAWDSRGARWLFQPDAEFYRLMRNGADVSISVHSGVSDRDIRIPFSTDGFPGPARAFERDLAGRLNQIAGNWDRSRRGRAAPPPPPPPPSEGRDPHDRDREAAIAEYRPPADSCGPQTAVPVQDPNGYAPLDSTRLAATGVELRKLQAWVVCESGWVKQYQASVNALGARVAEPGQPPRNALATVRGGAQVMTNLATAEHEFSISANRYAAHMQAYRVAVVRIRAAQQPPPGSGAPPTPGSPPAPPSSSVPPVLTPSPTPTPVPGGDHGHHGHDHQPDQAPPGSTPATTPSPAPQNPTAPAGPRDGGGHHHEGPGVSPTPATTPSPAASAPATNHAAELAAFHPPVETCGAQPAYPASEPGSYATLPPAQLKAAEPALAKVGAWFQCRGVWLKKYQADVTALGGRVSEPGQKLTSTPAGLAVAQALVTEQKEYAATFATYNAHLHAYREAMAKPAAPAPEKPTPTPAHPTPAPTQKP